MELAVMKRVLLLIDTSRASGRKFLVGIERYVSLREEWEVCVQPPEYLPTRGTGLRAWLDRPDGIICRDSPHTAKILKMDIPKVINETARESLPGVASIYTDSARIGELAADYFRDSGFCHFAFCGFENMEWSRKRFEAFSARLRENNYAPVHTFHSWRGSREKGERESLSGWLESLPRPVCVFACNDDRGVDVIQACQNSGFKVPEEVAVLGVDNDELVCGLSFPPLSSIELDFARAGFDAACLLDLQMRQEPSAEDIVVKPGGIVTRRSSDIIAVDDAEVAKALIFIRNNFRKQLQVSDIVGATNLSRRMLELRFRHQLGKSLMDEVWRLRLEYAKKLLANTDDPVYRIADALEYTDPEHFARFFKKMTGHTPSEYRRLLHT
jgi:LacI family transcriptional regulator